MMNHMLSLNFQDLISQSIERKLKKITTQSTKILKIHILIPGIYEYNNLHDEKDFADVVKIEK